MKVIQVSHSDALGGAARAAYRIHQALRAASVDSTMWVNRALTGDWTVVGTQRVSGKAKDAVRGGLGAWLTFTLGTPGEPLHSLQVLPSRKVSQLNASDADIVNLHWVQDEMLAVADIPRIRKPLVWTLHDMWLFCGAEHYAQDERWREGYRTDNRPTHEHGLDINRWTWNRKRRSWKKPMHLVAPSRWLAECIGNSALLSDWPVTVIPNPVDTEIWRPLPRKLARELLRLPLDVPLVLFGALGGAQDTRKGFDLLQSALRLMRSSTHTREMELAVFGQLAPREPLDLGFPVHYLGRLGDNWSLIALYSAADLLVVPSRQENLPQAATEAHACGTPVVSFDIGGLPDIIEHRRTGYLAKAFDVEDLAMGICWVLGASGTQELGERSRARAVERFSPGVVADQYKALYSQIL